MSKRISILFIALYVVLQLYPQAGRSVYTFLDLPKSSRLGALGGTNISLRDNDINFAFQNPSLLTAQTKSVIGLNMTNYLADIKFGSAIYGHTFGEKNYVAFGIHYVDYGDFKGMTEDHEYTGDFTAKDMALNIIYARPINRYFTIGVTLKPIYSVYETYTSWGGALDVGVNYYNEKQLLSAGLAFRNMGMQFKGYRPEEEGEHSELLPFDIQLGITKKLSHAPFRFSITLNNLHRWDFKYQSTNQSSTSLTESDDKKDDQSGFFDKAFRHAIVGAEFVPGKNFYIAVGYNHRRKKELSIDGFKNMTGFSFGTGIKLYKFQVGFGMSQFQTGLYSYQFSISASLDEFTL